MNKLVKCIAILLMVTSSSLCVGQKKGIVFEKGLDLATAQSEAKFSHKLIFIDCYASWCGPCKAMDKEVYTNDSVSKLFNDAFICLKLQMDTTTSDDNFVKNTYADAHYISNDYKIKAFPTFLFLSADGELLHKGIGYKGGADFITLANDALDPKRQFYPLLNKYKNGERDTSMMLYLINVSKSLGDEGLSERIADTYIADFLLKLDSSALFSKMHLSFICENTRSTIAPGFQLLYKHQMLIGRILENPTFVENVIEYDITRDEIEPVLWLPDGHPRDSVDWVAISSEVTRKFGEHFAEWTILGAKMRWYGARRDWPNFATNTYHFVDKYGLAMSDNDLDLNAWSIFQHSSNRDELRAAINWIKRVLQKQPNWTNAIDTYANLLYKLGEKKEGIAVEKRAISLETLEQNKSEFKQSLAKMKVGEPTWPTR